MEVLIIFVLIWISCLGVGGILALATLVHSGVITFPGTAQREISRAKANALIQEHNANAEEARLRIQQIQFSQEAERIRFNAILDQAIEAKQLKEGVN